MAQIYSLERVSNQTWFLGFHRGFQILCQESHPPLYRFMRKLVVVEVNAQNVIVSKKLEKIGEKSRIHIGIASNFAE